MDFACSRSVVFQEAPGLLPGDNAVVVGVELAEHHGPHAVAAFALHCLHILVGDAGGLCAVDRELLELFDDEDAVTVFVVLNKKILADFFIFGVWHARIHFGLSHRIFLRR